MLSQVAYDRPMLSRLKPQTTDHSQALAHNLRSLLLVRGCFLLSVVIALAYCHLQLHLPLAYQSMLWIITGLTLTSVASLAIMKRVATRPSHLFSQLLIDQLAVTGLLFFTGGADNPFVSYYLVPLCVAAANLSGRSTGLLMLISMALYTALFFFRIPLPDLAPHHLHSNDSTFSSHSLGMWINFALSATLISFFVVRMASALRHQQEQLQTLTEQSLRDEQLLSLATLAASTAHDLGTPLTTVKTLVEEIQADYPQEPALQQDLNLLASQIHLCSENLKQLSERAAYLKAGVGKSGAPDKICQQVFDHWLLMRPEVEASIDINPGPPLEVTLHPTLLQAIANLLNNAADANPQGIRVLLNWSDERLSLDIYDQGPGIDPELAHSINQPFESSKGDGRGLGLFLTQAALQRYGGSLRLQNQAEGGTHTHMTFHFDSSHYEAFDKDA